MKRVAMQRRAMRDLSDARAWLRGEAPESVPAFALEVDQALRHLRQHSATGSPRCGELLGMPGLRSWPLTRFRYLVLYMDCAETVTVLRVLHQSRDIPAHLQRIE